MGGWSKITLWKRVMLGLFLGLLAGLAIRYGMGAETVDGERVWASADFANTWLKPFGDGFVRLIKMLVVPLIFTTLVSGVMAMGDTRAAAGPVGATCPAGRPAPTIRSTASAAGIACPRVSARRLARRRLADVGVAGIVFSRRVPSRRDWRRDFLSSPDRERVSSS